MQQLENELAQTQSNLEQATHNLEEKEKALQNVSHFEAFCHETKKAWNGFTNVWFRFLSVCLFYLSVSGIIFLCVFNFLYSDDAFANTFLMNESTL